MMIFKKRHYLEKNIRTNLKATKEDTSAPGPSNVVINEKTPMSTANKGTSVQAVSPTPTPSTSCTSAPITTSKRYQDKISYSAANRATIFGLTLMSNEGNSQFNLATLSAQDTQRLADTQWQVRVV
ncbi:hypothetical protein CU097_009551 [Rhizopus azygosporus]|uniref:Uncharacterized protein n=1 Tax=Rhizopus azygosporus TaxID=86630 RepID=A0A367K317_RHIAZ|nr:hypothetical protein CU097_009551 [Rhizopus azygosporus]